MKIILLYLFIINAIGFGYMLADKYRARKNLWRIPESRLMLIAAAGGSAGVILGMHLAHHKTRHVKFAIVVPVLFALHTVIAVILLSNVI